MKYLKKFESFGQFQLDEISKQEYYSILDNNPLVYIPENKVLEFKSNLSKEYKLLYARGDKKDTVEYFRAEYETEIDYHFTCKSFSIKKKSQGVDEPCYIMSYNYEEFTSFEAPKSHIETLPDQQRISFQKKSYYRFEESDFDQMCKNPQILLDYLEKNLDNTPINESYFDEIPEPELMDLNEWDEEVTNAREVDFTQQEKELLIALSDTILVKHKIDALEIGDSHLSFSMVNGEDGIYPNLRSTNVIRSITSYKNDDEYYYVNVWGDDSQSVLAFQCNWETKSYRCDGYKCWEKFLKEIFAGYRDLINNQTKTNESFGGAYYKEIEPIDFFRANGIGLNEKELKEISRIINEKQGWIEKHSGAIITLHIPRQVGTVTLDEHTNLKKGYDEFYYVHYDIMNRKEFYEADQFDGLLKLLDDIL